MMIRMSVFKPKGSKVYHLEFVFQNDRYRESTGVTSKTAAREVEIKRKKEVRELAAGISKKHQTRSVADAFEDLRKSKSKWAPKTLEMAKNSFAHLGPVLGNKRLDQVRPEHIKAYQTTRVAEGASNRSVNIETGLLKALLRRAGLFERVRNHVESLKERTDAGSSLTPEQERALLEECSKSRSRCLLPMVTVLLETGSRFGTVQRLIWSDVDFIAQRVHFGKDKTEAGSGRTVPMTPRCYQTLLAWSGNFPERKDAHFVFPSEKVSGMGVDEVFGFTGVSYDTDPTRPVGTIKTAWESARERTRLHCPKCGSGKLQSIAEARIYRCDSCSWKTDTLPVACSKFRIHDLRHSAVSRMVSAGFPLPLIGSIVGWSVGTLALMVKRYGHFSEAAMRDALDSISGALPPKVPIATDQQSQNRGVN
jgi:integrase